MCDLYVYVYDCVFVFHSPAQPATVADSMLVDDVSTAPHFPSGADISPVMIRGNSDHINLAEGSPAHTRSLPIHPFLTSMPELTPHNTHTHTTQVCRGLGYVLSL